MTVKEFIPKYTEWLKLNGIIAEPSVEKADGTDVSTADVRYVAPTQLVWRNAFGSRISISAEMCMGAEVTGWYEVAAFLGVTGTPTVSWEDFINPPRTVDKQFSVGPAINAATVTAFTYPGSVVEAGKKYFQQGGLDVPEGFIYTSSEGKRYLSIKPNPFTTWLKEL